MGRRVVLRAVVVAATTGIGGGLLAPMAAHAAVVCGQTITTSMTLDQDLVCPGNGVIIGASNVVFDLGGHTITGPAPTGTTGQGVRGVSTQQNRTGITIRNGAIRGFDSGVDVLPGANGTTVTGLILDSNGGGIRVSTGASSNRLADNVIVNTTNFSGIQIGGNGHVIENNAMNNVASTGVFLSGNNGVIRNNRINDAGGSAITIGAFPSNPGPFVGNQVTGNQISGSSRVFNSTAISITNGSGTRLEGNTVNGRRTTPGIFLNESANSVVSGNVLVNNSTGVLVRGASTTGTQIRANQAFQNVFSGVAVESAPTSTLVADNSVSGNGGNGISVSSASTTIARNTATYNGSLGIFAVAGVTDGGGNRAFGNANPAQCSPSIVCTS